MAFNQQQIIDQVAAYLSKRFLAPNVRINKSDSFADVGIDSMTVVELVMFIEEEFDIAIPADQLTADNLKSLETLARCAEQNQQA